MISEGAIAGEGGRTWYAVSGDGDDVLVLLHGGPGAGSAYLESLNALASGMRVVAFDQLGCGKSDRPTSDRLWSIDRFVAEVDLVRSSVGSDRIHVLGHSWGGMLGLEYALAYPDRVASLILASTTASMPLVSQEMKRLAGELPSGALRALLTRALADGATDPEYREAMAQFDNRHTCRLDPWPPELRRSFDDFVATPVYRYMWGPKFFPSGSLATWDRVDWLSEIMIPTLVTVGAFDALTPKCAAQLHAGIVGSQLCIFHESSHVPHIEEPQSYLDVIARFLEAQSNSARLDAR